MYNLTNEDRTVLAALKSNRKYVRRTAKGVAKDTGLGLEMVENVLNAEPHKLYVKRTELGGVDNDAERARYSETLRGLKAELEELSAFTSNTLDIERDIEQVEMYINDIPANVPPTVYYELNFEAFMILRG